MLVHISVTNQNLQPHADGVGRALRDVGDDVVLSTPDTDHREQTDRVRGADALVCIVGTVDDLRRDGTVPGEWEFAVAVEQQVPVIACTLAVPEHAATYGRAGYRLARLTHFREKLGRETRVRQCRDLENLQSSVLADLEGVRERLRASAPDAFRSIYRRLRAKADARFDALAVSMHNMDTVYKVPQIALNSEVPSRFVAREPGGAGANTMAALSRLGLRTAVVGAVGDDPIGVDLRTSLEDDDVDVGLLATIEETRSGSAILIRDDDQVYVNLVSGDANSRAADALGRPPHRERLREAMRRSKLVHLSSFSGPSEREMQAQLAVELDAETVLAFRPSSLDAGLGADRLQSLLGRCDVLVLAEAELDLLWSSAPTREVADVRDRLAALFDWRNRRGFTSPVIVVIYGGSKEIGPQTVLTICWGADRLEGLVPSDRPLQLPSSPTWDPIGARDAAAAGVLYGLVRGRTPADCANLGYVLAMCASSAFGSRAGLPRRSMVREKWRELMEVTEPPEWLDPYG